ncbi:RNA 2',3'-cyclic phosphodiesterase [Dyella nitratireducens]|uniref:RNA 2',3'-cyclic phosphodiesterase n=1 Tax=Dyella nitratireducens TaxID=1849580 RepID=A0ABQ1GJH7_9GAMM|nr:RNA 2',3'-cyclic phosphodiesterase [Dyella nitratireducens]GGA44757.1 RNA 2',3'-cyclic phosphodiesterase [Dyella nitratireducens]GLQ41229.1 RNA 2',3'-cyclic phosphodiesterase [Dyella nitratireducens]
MLPQGSLPGFDLAIPTDRLFLAVFPDPAYAARFEIFAAKHLAARRMDGKPVEAARIHLTLFHLGDFTELPPGLATRAAEALSHLEAEPFTIRFDQIGSFNNRSSHGDFVLTASDGNEPLHALRQQLATHLNAAALNSYTKGSFTPHMTLAYNKPAAPFQSIEPIVWPAHEVVLIHSLLGKTRHIRIAEKPLH